MVCRYRWEGRLRGQLSVLLDLMERYNRPRGSLDRAADSGLPQ